MHLQHFPPAVPTSRRQFLLRASYLEIFKERIRLPGGAADGLPLQDNGILPVLREEAIMSVEGLKAVRNRGEVNRRTANTRWQLETPAAFAM